MIEEWLEFISHTKKANFRNKLAKSPSSLNVKISNKLDDSFYLSKIEKPSFQGDINYRLLKKIKNDKLLLEAKLDLHGMTLEQAYQNLKKFLLDSYKIGYTRLLVVTGKAKNSSQSTIRNNIEEWVRSSEEMSKLVTAISVASDRHGGNGALYFTLLRKK